MVNHGMQLEITRSRTGLRPPFLFGIRGGSCDAELPSLGTVALSGSGDSDSESGVRASSRGSCLGATFSLSVFEVVTSLVAMDPIPTGGQKPS